jgi:4a-hydroxytetrahydrobiopterin dehydratase
MIAGSEELAAKSCVPCKGGVPPLAGAELDRLLDQLGPNGWEVDDGHHLEKTYTFPDFAQALAFVDRVGAIAEREGHHPDLHLSWGRVRIEIWTHKINGLTESDFVLAAKCDRALAA